MSNILIIKVKKPRDLIARELFENPFNKPQTHEPKKKRLHKRLTRREIERAFEDL